MWWSLLVQKRPGVGFNLWADLYFRSQQCVRYSCSYWTAEKRFFFCLDWDDHHAFGIDAVLAITMGWSGCWFGQKPRANSSVYTNIARVFTVVYSFHRQEHGIFGHPGFICQQHVAGAYSLHVGRFVRGTGRCRCPGDVDDGRPGRCTRCGLRPSPHGLRDGYQRRPVSISGYLRKPVNLRMETKCLGTWCTCNFNVYDIFILNVRFCSIFGHKWEFISVYINPFLF